MCGTLSPFWQISNIQGRNVFSNNTPASIEYQPNIAPGSPVAHGKNLMAGQGFCWGY